MQRVAGAPEIVPADAIDLVQVLMDWIVDAVEVGEATGVKPPPSRHHLSTFAHAVIIVHVAGAELGAAWSQAVLEPR